MFVDYGQTQPRCEVWDKISLWTRLSLMGGENHFWRGCAVTYVSEPLVPTPQTLNLSRHRALSLLQASDLIYLQS